MYESAAQQALIRRVILDAIGDGVIAINCSRQILFANKALCDRAKYEYDELLGTSLDDLIPENLRVRHIEHLTRFCEMPSQRPMAKAVELPLRAKDGSTIMARTALGFQNHPVHGQILTAVLRWADE